MHIEVNNTVKSLLVSRSDLVGGAAGAAWRLHRAFIHQGIDSQMRVAVRISDDWRVMGPRGNLGKGMVLLRSILGILPKCLQRTSNPILHSSAFIPTRLDKALNACAAEVIHLHWVNGEMISIAEIGRITKPMVMTLHDMWAFCGAEHYVDDTPDARFRQGYLPGNRPAGQGGLDIDRWTWKRKRRAWRRPIHIIAPSRWLAECASSSALMRDWPIAVIPNALDTNIYRPHEKTWCREVLGLPTDVPLILFGAMRGGKDPRKGFDLLVAALQASSGMSALSGVRCVVFGQSQPKDVPRLGLPVHWLGFLHDDATLTLLYNAVDVVVIPSRQDNLPQVGTEAQACGTPVVAFNCTGLPDVVEHGVTGYLADPYSSDDLAKGIRWVLEDSERHAALCTAARMRAVRLWSPEVVVPQYLSVYEAAIASQGG